MPVSSLFMQQYLVDHFGIDRLGQVQVTARPPGGLLVFIATVAGHGDQQGSAAPFRRPQPPRHLPTVQARQADVEEDNVRHGGVRLLEGVLPRGRYPGHVTPRLDQEGQATG